MGRRPISSYECVIQLLTIAPMKIWRDQCIFHCFFQLGSTRSHLRQLGYEIPLAAKHVGIEKCVTKALPPQQTNIAMENEAFIGSIYYLVGGWATPLKNMRVNWDDEQPNISGTIK